MILDKHLIFVTGADTPATRTKALPLGQKDLTGDTSGMGPYSNLFLQVNAAANIAALTVTLEHADEEAGTFATLLSSQALTNLKSGDLVFKAPIPFSVKNWVRLALSVAEPVNAFLVYGVDKGVNDND